MRQAQGVQEPLASMVSPASPEVVSPYNLPLRLREALPWWEHNCSQDKLNLIKTVVKADYELPAVF